jgi:hypothetical protein
MGELELHKRLGGKKKRKKTKQNLFERPMQEGIDCQFPAFG